MGAYQVKGLVLSEMEHSSRFLSQKIKSMESGIRAVDAV